MKQTIFILAGLFLFTGMAAAQEHWTEGPVWACTAYRTKPGHFDDYMKYLRANYVVTSAEQKKQGLILDSKVFTKFPSNPQDWDVMICSQYPSYGKALDFDADADAKNKAISATHFKTADQDKQREVTAQRFEYRDFVFSDLIREVTLRPLP
jgi:hypothetical protein